MAAPPELANNIKAQLIAAIDAQLLSMIDEVWDASQRATLERINSAVTDIASPTGPKAAPREGLGMARLNSLLHTAAEAIDRVNTAAMSPQKRGAQNRAPKGLIKSTIKELIDSNPREGLTVAQIRDVAQTARGVTIKEGSMKQGLRLLQKEGAIQRRGLFYFPTKNGGQSND